MQLSKKSGALPRICPQFLTPEESFDGRPHRGHPVDQTTELEAAAAEVINACGGDLARTIEAPIVGNSLLEQEFADIYAKASRRHPAGDASSRRCEIAYAGAKSTIRTARGVKFFIAVED
jgi:hypothetical protein